MGDYGIKVSTEGAAVLSATDTQLAFSSKFNSLKVALSGQASVTVPVGTPASGYTDVTHNLGYIPHALIYATDSPVLLNDVWHMPFYDVDPGYQYTLGTAKLRITAGVEANDSQYNVTFYYYIFVDET